MKRKRIVIAASIVFLINTIFAQQANQEWSISIGASFGESVDGVTSDPEGNVYTIGRFKGTVDFDPGIGTHYISSHNEYNLDVFIQKLDALGNLIWVKSIEESNGIFGRGIAIDDGGNIYTTGEFRGTVDFDPGDAVFNLESSEGGLSLYIQKLNNDGDFLWAKALYCNDGGNNFVRTIALDAARNIYISGEFVSELDFDPGEETYYISVEEWHDIFVEKLDTDGNFIWVKPIKITDLSSQSRGIVVDSEENVYTTGYFSGTADFDPSDAVYEQTSIAYNDIFIQKLDSNGAFEWAVTMGGNVSENPNAIATDSGGNIYSIGSFANSVDFDPSEAVNNLTSNGSNDVYIQKLDPDGNLIWAKSFGGMGSDEGHAISLDIFNSIYITGRFSETADFDPSEATLNKTSQGDSDIFILKLDENGEFKWVKAMGGIENDSGISISLDSHSNVITTGTFRESVDFNSEGASLVLTSNGENDIFITKYSQETLGQDEYLLSDVTIVPNPSTAIFSISWITDSVDVISVIDLSGKEVYTSTYINKDAHEYTLDLSKLKSGVYFVCLSKQNGKLVKKIVLT